MTTDIGLAASVAASDWMLAGFDLTVLVCGLAFAAAARRLQSLGRRAQHTPLEEGRIARVGDAEPVPRG